MSTSAYATCTMVSVRAHMSSTRFKTKASNVFFRLADFLINMLNITGYVRTHYVLAKLGNCSVANHYTGKRVPSLTGCT